ncbi:MAG: DUF1579 family protein [Planctomycetota bacterium]
MQIKNMILAATVLLAGTACKSTHEHSHGAHADMSPQEMEAMMARMMELATPGPEHKELAEMVGAWDQKVKMRMSPDTPWTESTGTTECTSLLDGRYILEKLEMVMPPMPGTDAPMVMKGAQIIGFDKMTGEYTSIWMDSWSTWAQFTRGKKGADGTVELKGTMVDVAGKRPFRIVIKHGPDGHTHSEMFDTIDGKEVQMMIIDATKRK